MRTLTIVGRKHFGVVIVDDCDYERVASHKWTLLPRYDKRGYYACRYEIIDGRRKNILMHRLLSSVTSQQWVDHVNGDGLDNRSENLRVCDSRQNQGNRLKSKEKAGRKTSSIYKGVWFNHRDEKWYAQCANKKLGSHNTEIQAALAYDNYAEVYFGEFARLNFPKKRPLAGLMFQRELLVG